MKRILLLCIMFFYTPLFAKIHHNQLVLPSLTISHPHWEYCGTELAEKQSGLFSQLILTWNTKLAQAWKKLQTKIYQDLKITAEQIDYYLEDPRFIAAYFQSYHEIFSQLMHEKTDEQINPIIKNYIENKLSYLHVDQLVRIYLCKNIGVATYTFGTNTEGYYLLLNSTICNTKAMSELYRTHDDQTPYFYIKPYTANQESRIIEYSNFLHITLAQAASDIIHQADYFGKMLQLFTYNQQQLSPETQRYGTDYQLFRSLLEACLQSKNPIEAAIFLQDDLQHVHQEFVLLWQDFIADLEYCYDADDLAYYYQAIQEERRARLYTQ